MSNPSSLGNYKIDIRSMAETLEYIKDKIESDKKIQVSVFNSFSLYLVNKDEDYRIACNRSHLTLADGMPLVWLSHLYGKSIPERVAGPDLFLELSGLAEKQGYSCFLMGSSDDTLQRLRDYLNNKCPDLKIKGSLSPPFKKVYSEEENMKLIEVINKSQSDILWVGLGAPKQEKWIYANLDKLNVKVAIGVGAAFDFYSGNIKRAPKWMRAIGMEWFWRLIKDPLRLCKRYLVSLIYLIKYATGSLKKNEKPMSVV